MVYCYNGKRMKKVFEYWMPDSDEHFERLITKRVKNGGPAQYQDDVRDEAYKHITDFNLAIDVGANVGLWAKHLAEKFNEIYAFEPISEVYECLEKNVSGQNVVLNNFALGNTNSTIELVYDSENTGASYVDDNSIGKGTIDIKRMDDLGLPKFGLLKIDCERYELEVLKGGTETILKYKPIIVVEQHPDTEYCAGAYLKSLGAKQITNVRKDYIFGW
jgi:FkbM family methyltransferase